MEWKCAGGAASVREEVEWRVQVCNGKLGDEIDERKNGWKDGKRKLEIERAKVKEVKMYERGKGKKGKGGEQGREITRY